MDIIHTSYESILSKWLEVCKLNNALQKQLNRLLIEQIKAKKSISNIETIINENDKRLSEV